jgi:MFS family permease
MTGDSGQLAVSGAVEKAGYARFILAVCFIITCLSYAGAYSFGLFFKPLQAEFGWSSAQTSGIFSLFILSYAIAGIPTGWACDRLGPRFTMLAGGLCFGLGFALSGLVHELWQLYLFYGILVGAGTSSVYGPLLTTASRWFQKRPGPAMGLVSSGMGLGTFIGPMIFGSLISMYGWRFSYLAGGAAIGGAMVLLGLCLSKDPVQATEDPEARKLSEAGEDQCRSGVEGWSALEVLRTRQFWLFAMVYLMVGFSIQMMLAHLIPHMQETHHWSPRAAAALLSLVGIVSATGRLVMGGVSDYLGPRRSLSFSVALEGVAVVLIIFSTRPWMFYTAAVFLGFGYGGHSPQLPALVRELFGMRQMGRNVGLQSVFYGGGAFLGPLFAGWIFDRTGSYVVPFAGAACTLMLSSCVALMLKRPPSWG